MAARKSENKQLYSQILCLAVCVGLIGLCGCFQCQDQAGGEAVRVAKPEFPLASFRVVFGLKDNEPTSWNGQLLVEEDQESVVEPDYFYAAPTRDVLEQEVESRAEHPFDYMAGETSWFCRTREGPSGLPSDEWINRSEQQATPILKHPSILVHVRLGMDSPLGVQTAEGSFEFRPADFRPGKSTLFLDGGVKVTRIPPATAVARDPSGYQDFPVVFQSSEGDLWVAWQEFDGETDSVCVRRKSQGQWSSVTSLAKGADVFHVSLAEDSSGDLWVIWAGQVKGNWDLYGRRYDGSRWLKTGRLTEDESSDCYHQVATGSDGLLWLIWQRTLDGVSQIMLKSFDGSSWSEERQLSNGVSAGGNNWWPVLATGSEGTVAAAWDGYASGSYDIYLRIFREGEWGQVEAVVNTPRFEAHPTLVIDAEGRIWLAWDESGMNWGKDTGFLVADPATQLYQSRRVRLKCLDRGRQLRTIADIAEVLPTAERWELPHLVLDASGYPVLFVRHLNPASPDTPAHAPLYSFLWEIYVTRYDGQAWTEPVRLPHCPGRNDMLASAALDREGILWAVWATDRRSTNAWHEIQSEVQIGFLESLEPSRPLALEPDQDEQPKPLRFFDRHEKENIERVRAYRIKKESKTYRIYRGDLHRHTDISADGGHDGSLVDAYRYARDAADLDFLAVTDHNDTVERPYAWWRTQKIADLFRSDHFAAFYSYERSVGFPNGHRNVFYTKRGLSVLPIAPSEQAAWEGAEQLYAYLHRVGGFSIPHTTARWSGTDWRNHDPDVEPLVEIYQGMRDTYEYDGAPKPKRLSSDFIDASKLIPRAASVPGAVSYRPQGFVWEALDKGHKLGFIASSDHISTHISYAFLIAEELSLPSLLEAARSRRAYAATTNILLDVRYHGSDGQHLMGEIFRSQTPVRVSVKVTGTENIKQIDIIKNEESVHTLHPGSVEVAFEFEDRNISPGESYYYVRVIQENGDMAWGSPSWVRYD